jgi:hypothetical protein
VAKQPGLGRPEATCAALIPIRKDPSWWGFSQDERRKIFEEQSRHIHVGLQYLPAVARRFHHCRDLGENEPFDFLTWFEYSPADEAAFNRLVAEFRASVEWKYVDREIDIRLLREPPEQTRAADAASRLPCRRIPLAYTWKPWMPRSDSAGQPASSGMPETLKRTGSRTGSPQPNASRCFEPAVDRRTGCGALRGRKPLLRARADGRRTGAVPGLHLARPTDPGGVARPSHGSCRRRAWQHFARSRPRTNRACATQNIGRCTSHRCSSSSA